jgi:hypothetical protein
MGNGKISRFRPDSILPLFPNGSNCARQYFPKVLLPVETHEFNANITETALMQADSPQSFLFSSLTNGMELEAAPTAGRTSS